jgi:Flp pilus assembly pilin Flp
MGMKAQVQRYVDDDTGAVTIDWVVITGFLAGLALSVMAAISPSMEQQGTEIVDRAAISTTF